MASLQELFRDALLPPDRKLRYFSEQPLAASAAGAYTRPLFGSTSAVSDTKYTLDTPYYPPKPTEHPLNNP